MAKFRSVAYCKLHVEIAREDAKRAVVRRKHKRGVLAIENIVIDGNSGQDCALQKLLGMAVRSWR